MVTDAPPKSRSPLEEFDHSDRLVDLAVPADDRLLAAAEAIQAAMKTARRGQVEQTCAMFLQQAADFYRVSRPPVRVLAARPLRTSDDGWGTELFGDYDFQTKLIRVWMRTAVRKEITSFGTFLSTLCHELCNHLDFELFHFQRTPHTRGFYERTAAVYHSARGTPRKRLVWAPLRGGRWRIDWAKSNKLVQ